MEKTSENKAKFFAQYMFQRVLMWHDESILYAVDGSDLAIVSTKKTNYFLLLKPLSSITDEDVRNCVDENGEYWGNTKSAFNNGIDNFIKTLTLASYDYLRFKGYALPWMGLSVEALIEYGWIKLNQPPATV